MEPAADLRATAWCPLTSRGVATFAHAAATRLFLVQLLIGLAAAGLMVWGLSATWFPVIAAAVDRLPQSGEIVSGSLKWSADSPQVLAENRFLAIAVDLDHAAQARSPAHVQIEFGQADIRCYSLFGYLQFYCPKGYRLSFNYPELKPWWGAWSPGFLGMTAVGTFAGLIVSWAALATVYCLPVWLLGLYLNRDLSLTGSWRLSGAALMPGALLMMASLMLYCLGQLDLVRLLAAFLLHFLIGWVYLVLGAVAAPKLAAEPNLKANPFHQAVQAEASPEAISKKEPNPFRPSGD